MKKTIYLLLIIIQVFTLSSCKHLFKKPALKQVHDIKVQSITPDKTEVSISMEISNPNGYKLELQNVTLQLADKDRHGIGSASIKNKITIPKKHSFSWTNLSWTPVSLPN